MNWGYPLGRASGSNNLGPVQPSYAHKTRICRVTVIAYRWHPLHGQQVTLLWAQQFSGREYAVCRLSNGTQHPVPAWMLDVSQCAQHGAGPPMLSLHALQELRRVLTQHLGTSLCDGQGMVSSQEDSLGTKTDSSSAASPSAGKGRLPDDARGCDSGVASVDSTSAEPPDSASRSRPARPSRRRKGEH